MSTISFTAAGNLTADPELRFTGTGKPVANVRIEVTPRRGRHRGGRRRGPRVMYSRSFFDLDGHGWQVMWMDPAAAAPALAASTGDAAAPA